MLYIQLKTIEKITAVLVLLNIAVLAVLSYNYYLNI